ERPRESSSVIWYQPDASAHEEPGLEVVRVSDAEPTIRRPKQSAPESVPSIVPPRTVSVGPGCGPNEPPRSAVWGGATIAPLMKTQLIVVRRKSSAVPSASMTASTA